MDKDGTPRIAGFGNTYILSRSTTSKAEGGTNINRLSRSRRPESTRRGISSSGIGVTHPTKADDMLAFGFVAFEVRIDSFAWHLPVCSPAADSDRETPVLWDDQGCGHVLDAEQKKTTTAEQLQGFRCDVADDPRLLEPRGVKANGNRRGGCSHRGGVGSHCHARRLKGYLEMMYIHNGSSTAIRMCLTIQ